MIIIHQSSEANNSNLEQIFITGWWLCPELYLRRPFQNHGSSRLAALLEARAKQGVQVLSWLFFLTLIFIRKCQEPGYEGLGVGIMKQPLPLVICPNHVWLACLLLHMPS